MKRARRNQEGETLRPALGLGAKRLLYRRGFDLKTHALALLE